MGPTSRVLPRDRPLGPIPQIELLFIRGRPLGPAPLDRSTVGRPGKPLTVVAQLAKQVDGKVLVGRLRLLQVHEWAIAT